MVKFTDIREALNERKNRLLLVAEAAMPRSQFEAFRRCVLNELGEKGFEKDLRTLLGGAAGMEGTGMGRHGMKGGEP